MRNNNKVTQTGGNKRIRRVNPRHHTSNLKVKEKDKRKRRDQFASIFVCFPLTPNIACECPWCWCPHSSREVLKEFLHGIPPPGLTLNKSTITVHSSELEELSFNVLWKCCITLEISRMFMFKHRRKQWRDIRLGRVSENKDNLYPVWRKNTIWEMLWVDEPQNTHLPVIITGWSSPGRSPDSWVLNSAHELHSALWLSGCT